MLYVGHYLPMTEVLGPGKRFALWLQGCERRCPGCINPAGWSLTTGGTMYSVEHLADIICDAAPALTGITISGGEPMLQHEPLGRLLDLLAERTALDVILYTGYTLEEVYTLLSGQADTFLNKIDILIDGSYIEQENHNEMLRGSANQKMYFFTEKYRRFAQQLETAKNRSIEFHGLSDGEMWMAGIPPKDFEETLYRTLSER